MNRQSRPIDPVPSKRDILEDLLADMAPLANAKLKPEAKTSLADAELIGDSPKYWAIRLGSLDSASNQALLLAVDRHGLLRYKNSRSFSDHWEDATGEKLDYVIEEVGLEALISRVADFLIHAYQGASSRDKVRLDRLVYTLENNLLL